MTAMFYTANLNFSKIMYLRVSHDSHKKQTLFHWIVSTLWCSDARQLFINEIRAESLHIM